MYYLVLVLILSANVVFAQPAFQSKDAQLLESFHSKFGLPTLDGDNARAWTLKLAEQFAFTFPGEGWGTKSGGNGRPPSTDVIARNCCGGLWGYDVILSQGTPGQQLISNPGVLNLVGQSFISVTPFNHLGTSSGGGGGGTPVIPPVDLAPLLARLTILEAQVTTLNAKIVALDQRDNEMTTAHFNLSDYARQTDGALGTRIDLLESRPIPVGCSARFLGRNVGCNLVFP